MTPPPHPLLAPLAGLVGVWSGAGVGRLPDQEPFSWTERFVVTHAGTPACAFQQRTRRSDGSPFHPEDGWVRVPPELQDEDASDDRRVELAVTSPTGILEALSGTSMTTADGIVLDVSSTSITRTEAAREVLATRRRWTLSGDRLTVEFWMATPSYPDLFHHLTTELHREGAST